MIVKNEDKYMDKKDIFGESNREYNINRPQYNLALDLLRGKTIKGNLLDLGCRLCEFSDMIKNQVNNGLNIFCVDGTDSFVKRAQKKGYEAFNVNLESERLPFDNQKFDLISLDVIEHLCNIENYLSEIDRVLAKNGFVVLTTVNHNAFNFRLKHLIGRFDDISLNFRHKIFFTEKSFRNVISKYFVIESELGMITIPFNKRNYIFKNLLNGKIGILGSKKSP